MRDSPTEPIEPFVADLFSGAKMNSQVSAVAPSALKSAPFPTVQTTVSTPNGVTPSAAAWANTVYLAQGVNYSEGSTIDNIRIQTRFSSRSRSRRTFASHGKGGSDEGEQELEQEEEGEQGEQEGGAHDGAHDEEDGAEQSKESPSAPLPSSPSHPSMHTDILKVVVVGNSMAGKTSMIARLNEMSLPRQAPSLPSASACSDSSFGAGRTQRDCTAASPSPSRSRNSASPINSPVNSPLPSPRTGAAVVEPPSGRVDSAHSVESTGSDGSGDNSRTVGLVSTSSVLA